MKVMLLAAGRGERMGPLTRNTPKPLVKAGGQTLIEHHIERLVEAGFTDVVINHARFGEQIEDLIGDGSRYGASVRFSREGEEPLETGGGIYQALALLEGTSFVVINADVWCDYPLKRLPEEPAGLAHLVLVPNPEHHPGGDFALNGDRISLQGQPRHTFSGIGVYRPEIFDECREGRFALAPVLRHAISQGLVAGEVYQGLWMDIGTPERLVALEAVLRG